MSKVPTPKSKPAKPEPPRRVRASGARRARMLELARSLRILPPAILFAICNLQFAICNSHCVAAENCPVEFSVGKPTPAIEVFFSPAGGCTAAVVAELAAARESVLVQAYGFTSAPTAEALVAAQRRGVKVQVILDRSQRTAKRSQARLLSRARIPVYFDGAHPIAHNKVMVIDGRTVITGSFNFTDEAERNAENLLIVKSSHLAAKYAANWRVHLSHSQRFPRKNK